MCDVYMDFVYVLSREGHDREQLGILVQTAGGTSEPKQAFCWLVNSLLDCVISYENGLCLHLLRVCDKKEEEHVCFIKR